MPHIQLFPGDCRDTLARIPSDSIDSCVTDPPYALVSIVKRFGSPDAAPLAATYARQVAALQALREVFAA